MSSYSANCPECGKEIEVDEYDYAERCESDRDSHGSNECEGEPILEPFYCVDCDIFFGDE